MKLHLQKIRFRNFLSFGNEWTEIQLNQNATTLVVGKNGSGKSAAILDAISFVLFNKSFRNINKPQLISSINQQDCLVELDCEANGYQFKVRRGLKPNVFEIFREGQLLNQTADNRDYQDAFEKYILKVNHKTFCQIVMLGSAIFVPFMALPAAQRRSVIEDLLDLQIFSTMNALLKDRITKNDLKLLELNNQRKILSEKEILIVQHIEDLKRLQSKNIENIEQQIVENHREMSKLEIEQANLHDRILQQTKQLIGRDKLLASYNETQKVFEKLNDKYQQVIREIKFLEEHTTCPSCRQTIGEEFKEQNLNEKKKHEEELYAAMDKLSIKMEAGEKLLAQMNDIQKDIDKKHSIIHDIEIKMNSFDWQNTKFQEEIDKVQNQSESIDTTLLEAIEQENSVVDKDIAATNAVKNTMAYATTMLKDSGIKSKIIKTYVPIINQLIAKYLAALDFFVDFNLNESFEETIKSRFRDTFAYENFSEGEKVRLNVAILFAWRALAKLRGSIDCNLIIMDEILDGSLDNEGLDNMLNLISSLTIEENVFIISHKTDQLADKFPKVIHFVKKNNFSIIQE